MANEFFSSFNNPFSTTSPVANKPLDPRIVDYMRQKNQLQNVQAPDSLKQNLAMSTQGDYIAVNPLDATLHDMAYNPNKSVNLNSALNYSRLTPSIEAKPSLMSEGSKAPMNEKVKSYLQAKMNPNKPTEASKDEKKEDGKGFDWSYVMQGLGAIGESMKTGGGDQSTLAGNFQGMRDTRDTKEELAKFNDPMNEKAVEYRDFIKSNFPSKVLKDVDLNKMNIADMQSMFGQFANREQADLNRQAMLARANGAGQRSFKAPSEAQAKAKGFSERMKMSGANVDNLEMQALKGEGGYDNRQLFGAPIEGLKSEERKKYESAQKDFIMANLRKESGAVIGADELEEQRKTYFPQIGDSDEVLAQKQRMRKQLQSNMVNEARPAYEYDSQYEQPRQSSNSGETTMRHPKTGKMYKVRNGQVIGEL